MLHDNDKIVYNKHEFTINGRPSMLAFVARAGSTVTQQPHGVDAKGLAVLLVLDSQVDSP